MSRVLLPLCLIFFFLVEERSEAKQPLVSLGAGAGGPVQADCTNIFLGVTLMFVGVVNFGHAPTLRFVGVEIFQSKSNGNLVIIIQPCELASKNHYLNNIKISKNLKID